MKTNNEENQKTQMRHLEAENKRLLEEYQKQKETAEQLHEIARQLIFQKYGGDSFEIIEPRKLSRRNTFILKLLLKLIG